MQNIILWLLLPINLTRFCVALLWIVLTAELGAVQQIQVTNLLDDPARLGLTSTTPTTTLFTFDVPAHSTQIVTVPDIVDTFTVYGGSTVTLSAIGPFYAPEAPFHLTVEPTQIKFRPMPGLGAPAAGGGATQGMEFVIIGMGFICASVAWRFILGRW